MNASLEWRPDGAMTVEHAAALWAAAGSHLASDPAACETQAETQDETQHVTRGVMHVDLSSIERLDTAGCQILIACREDATRRALDWRLTGCTAQTLDVLRLLGCDGILEPVTEEEAR